MSVVVTDKFKRKVLDAMCDKPGDMITINRIVIKGNEFGGISIDYCNRDMPIYHHVCEHVVDFQRGDNITLEFTDGEMRLTIL